MIGQMITILFLELVKLDPFALLYDRYVDHAVYTMLASEYEARQTSIIQ
jgi:hypothetical protein